MKVSIITVSYNSAGTIASSIQSVLDQDYEDVEYIVIDGKSTDGTVEILEQYRQKLDVLISEKDQGIFDAYNKGISMATGDLIGILNSDDLFYSTHVISEVVQALKDNPSDCLYGDLVYVDQKDTAKIIRTWQSGTYQRSKFLNGWMPPHPTFFIKRKCLQEDALYDSSFKSSGDYEFMLRYLFKNNLTATYLQKTLVRMRVGGISSGSLKNRLRANKEDMRAWKKNNLHPRPYTRLMKPLRKIGQFSLAHYSYKSTLSFSLILPLFIGFFHDFSSSIDDLNKIKIALAMIFAWGVAAVSVPVVIKITELKKLTDDPNTRSSHISPVPTLGGISVFAAILLSLTIWGAINNINGLQYFIGALAITFFTGLKDDMLIIAPDKKLVSQLLASGLIILGADLRIESLYGIMGIHDLSYFASLILSIIVFITITNAYNLIDGIDGLASTLGIIATLLFGSWFVMAKQIDFAILSFSTAGALIGFIKFNFSKNQKIFLGDTGSLIIGLLCATLALEFIKMNGLLSGQSYYFHNAPFIAMAIVGIPVFDILRVFLVRIYNRKSPFAPDRNHIHHILIQRNPSHKRATLVISACNVAFVISAVFLFKFISPTLALAIVLLSFILYLTICHKFQSTKKNTFKIFFMRNIPPIHDVLWPKFNKT